MGRSDPSWIDFDLFGHQIVAHHVQELEFWRAREAFTKVDKSNVPVPHFGIVLEIKDFKDFSSRLRLRGVKFEIEPQVRFQGKAGEQWTMVNLTVIN
jgi:extradiol dioxygenase family protein